MGAPPVVWAVCGSDSGGGAGLSADQRAADAFGVHLCPVVAAVTAQNSRAVQRLEPMPVELIEAQFAALAEDMPPAVLKTGLLGGAAQVRAVVRWIDRLRAERPVALVVDPVLGSSTGAAFADAATLAAYRDELLPRTTLLTPNRREAARLLGRPDEAGEAELPLLAEALRALGSAAVCITGGDSAARGGRVLDWFSGLHAEGWIGAPRVDTSATHGTGCTFASSAAAALALGFVAADSAVLAKMATLQALRQGYSAGGGAGPVRAGGGFGLVPSLLPRWSWDAEPDFAETTAAVPARRLGLYAVVDSAQRVEQALSGGIRTLQLRLKTPADPAADWPALLRAEIGRSISACRAAGAELFVNDHWQLAHELGAGGVHLGQEDLLALGPVGRAALRRSGLALGVSTHSLWELCRAASLAPRYIACGPVWPTLTKAMPWRPQGLGNLAWWVRMSPAPVVAIGGILGAAQVAEAAACGADGVCVVRALGDDPAVAAPALLDAVASAGSVAPTPAPALPRPSLAA